MAIPYQYRFEIEQVPPDCTGWAISARQDFNTGQCRVELRLSGPYGWTRSAWLDVSQEDFGQIGWDRPYPFELPTLYDLNCDRWIFGEMPAGAWMRPPRFEETTPG